MFQQFVERRIVLVKTSIKSFTVLFGLMFTQTYTKEHMLELQMHCNVDQKDLKLSWKEIHLTHEVT